MSEEAEKAKTGRPKGLVLEDMKHTHIYLDRKTYELAQKVAKLNSISYSTFARKAICEAARAEAKRLAKIPKL